MPIFGYINQNSFVSISKKGNMFLFFILLPLIEAASTCVDLDNDCADYGRDYICVGDYIPWSKIHCKKYCQFCDEAPEVLDTSTTSVATKSTSTEQSTAVATTTQISTSLPSIPATTATTVINMCPSQVEQRVQSQYLFHYGEKCYEFVPSNYSWMHAREDCHKKGGHMLSIVSPQEQTFIYNILATLNFTVQELWLGLDDRVNEEQWNWDSGDSVNYINWIPGRYIDQYHDQEDCAVVVTTRGGKWDDVDCNAVVSGGIMSNPWICQYARQTPTSNSTSATSSAGGWSSWFYGSCSVSCGTGTAHRVRRCSTGHIVDCSGKDFETVSCDAGPCPIDGSWNSWQQWSTCSTTCGDGIHFRTRDCDNPTPQHGGTNCSGSANETAHCHLIDCPPSWSSWFYGTCSETCGPGTRSRLRRCSSGQESDCTGKAFEIVTCNGGPCPIDGFWSSWQQWSTCSTTCGDGKRFRLRNCTNPTPQHGGRICSGSNNETSTCNISDCPHWLKFYEASSCSATCGTGFIQLKRNYSSGNPHDCHGILGADTPCEDLDSNCALYGRRYICNGDLIPWSSAHCRKYCNLCRDGNMALNKPATQSSNYVEGNNVWIANTAVDGNAICGYPPTYQNYSATLSGMPATSWWRVDLGKVFAVDRVIVYGMPKDVNNQLTGFRLYLTKQRVDHPDVSSSVYNNTDYGNGSFDIKLSEEGQFVMLMMPAPYDAIVLCEVKVYGTEVSKTSTVSTNYSTTATVNTTSALNLIATTATVVSMCPSQVEQRTPSQFLFQYGEKCYEFVPSNGSWAHAREYCHNEGGHLLSVTSANTQAFIYNSLTTINFTVQELWLGLDDRVNEEQWSWDSGESVNYINWIPGRYIDQYHDEEDCAVMDISRGGRWDDVDCNAVVSGGILSYPWICQYDRQMPVSNSTISVSAGGWSSWFYGSCSVSCGTGTTQRLRSCSSGNTADCKGTAFETVSCDAGPCPIDGSWGSWQQWSTCSTTCDDGLNVRIRDCDNPTPQHGGTNCTGSGNETSPCHLIDCPPSWSNWYYGTCPVTCGPGTTSRIRRCSTGNEAHCNGTAFEIIQCNEGPCPIDGSWSSWQQWSTCTSTCGDGFHFRLRNCTNPTPKHGGNICSGSNNETATCNISDCPYWFPFYETSSCSATCGAGFMQLQRNCSSGNSHDCQGSEYGEKPCNLMTCVL